MLGIVEQTLQENGLCKCPECEMEFTPKGIGGHIYMIHQGGKEKITNLSKYTRLKKECCFCGEERTLSNIKRHEDSCYLNPENLMECEACGNPIKNYRTSKGTCSYSCSNTYFRELRNKPEKYIRYQTICFYHHEKKCVKCGEENIVEVHHWDHDKTNNNPTNLIPLCPTHHKYMHSRFRYLVEKDVDKYRKDYINLNIGV